MAVLAADLLGIDDNAVSAGIARPQTSRETPLLLLCSLFARRATVAFKRHMTTVSSRSIYVDLLSKQSFMALARSLLIQST